MNTIIVYHIPPIHTTSVKMGSAMMAHRTRLVTLLWSETSEAAMALAVGVERLFYVLCGERRPENRSEIVFAVS